MILFRRAMVTKIHKDVVYEKEKYPEDLTEKRIELNAAPATRLHMLDLLAAIEKGSRPVADVEARSHFNRKLHPGEPIHANRPADGLRSEEKGTGKRQRWQCASAAKISQSVGTSRSNRLYRNLRRYAKFVNPKKFNPMNRRDALKTASVTTGLGLLGSCEFR